MTTPATVTASSLKDGLLITGILDPVSKGVCRLQLTGQTALQAGDILPELSFDSGHAKQVLRHCRIDEIEAAPSGTVLLLSTADPASQAALWRLRHDVASGDHLSQQDWPEEPQIPFRGHYSMEKWQQRLEWLRQYARQPLSAIGDIGVDPESLKGNIEHFIGTVELPLGIAGPLYIRGAHARGYQFVPLATTEGALVASACRGAKALNLSGGVRTQVLGQQMMRAPVFVTASMDDALRLRAWVQEHLEEIREQVKQASRRAELLRVETCPIGRVLYLRFIYRTGDAAGQNMTTVATWKACQWLLARLQHYPEIRILQFQVESNWSGDKKVTALNYSEGRGTRVMAEAFLPDSVLQQVLKVSAEELVLGYQAFIGASLNMGMTGFNINISNAIAAVFTATGQDIACVHESSIGQLSIQRTPDGVYASLLLPSLVIGTVGGGTGLPAQQECLRLMGCAGSGQVERLAEIIAGCCLALDLSTLSAIVGGQFATAHEQLGRNRPDDGLKEEELTPSFFKEALREEIGEDAQVTGVLELPIDTGNSILSGLTSGRIKKKIGHFAYRVQWQRSVPPPDGGSESKEAGTLNVVLKAKPTGHEVVKMLHTMAQGCGNPLAAVYEQYQFDTGFRYCHLREPAVYRLHDARFTAIAPKCYHTWVDDDREIYAIVMEHLEGLSHMNTVGDVSVWEDAHIKAALSGIAGFHSIYLDRTEDLDAPEWQQRPNYAASTSMIPLWQALLAHNSREFPGLFPGETVVLLEGVLQAVPAFWAVLERAPKTLIHCDFNPRNIGLRQTEQGFQLCAYDWELATIHVPQHDVAEFLSFVLPPEVSAGERHRYLDFYRWELEHASGKQFEADEFLRIFQYASLDMAINRLGLYTMAHTFREYSFLPRVLESHFNYVRSINLPG